MMVDVLNSDSYNQVDWLFYLVVCVYALLLLVLVAASVVCTSLLLFPLLGTSNKLDFNACYWNVVGCCSSYFC